MKKLVLSTNNKNKVKEIKNILGHLPIEVVTMKDLGIESFKVIEDGDTLIENSRKKAEGLFEITENIMVMADDSGLFVDYLDGEPGVHSSRYAGEDGNDKLNNEKLMKELKDVPYEERTAKFKTAIVLIKENGEEIIAEGECPGHIIDEARGVNGFGYDPYFIPEGYDKTFAELDENIKDKISHRYRALEKLVTILEGLIEEEG